MLESWEEGLGDVNDLLADVNTVVAVYLLDLVEADNKRTMYAHKLLWRQHVLDRLHREMGDQRTTLAFEIEHHIVLHATDVDDVADGDLAVFAVDFEEEGGSSRVIICTLGYAACYRRDART